MRSKSRLIAVAASVLACAAMVGTGFASWVILDAQTKEATGNVKAEAVSTEGITLEVTAPTEDVIYGSPETMEAKNAWLVEDQSAGQGKFTADITVKVGGNIGSLAIAYTAPEGAFATAITQGLVAQYPTYSIGDVTTNSVITEAGQITIADKGDGTATVNFKGSASCNFTEETTFHVIATFGWGTAFGGQNPYNYFNDGQKTAGGAETGTAVSDCITDISGWTAKAEALELSATLGSATNWGTVAKSILGWMYEKFTDAEYTFTFTAQQAAPTKA